MAPSALPDDATHAEANKPCILVPEKVSPDGLKMLSSLYTVDIKMGLSAEELIKIIPSYHGLIVRSETKVTAEVLNAAKKMRVVARAGVGVDNIDVNAATQQGIIVVNSPAGNIVAAAEHTIALLLSTARNVGRADTTMKEGLWERSKLVGVEVGSKTLGIIGLGKVGLKVARMAVGLGMKVQAMDPYASADIAAKHSVELVSTLEDLLPAVDFLTIHTPLIASTLDMIGEKQLCMMKKTARVLNVARGGVYNEEALIRALDEGWIAGAGMDVFTSEPPKENSSALRLSKHPRVVATPHLGASTKEAQENVSLDVCAQMREILRGGLPTAAVNAPLILPEEYKKLQPFVKLVEKMGSLYTQHFVGSKGGMIGGRTFDLIYSGELANISNTRPLFAALVKGLMSTISDSKGRDVNIVNATLLAKEKGIAINETHLHEAKEIVYNSLVTLKSYDGAHRSEQVIEGYVSGKSFYISRLDQFASNFHPDGPMIILHNYDEPGKIGGVGMVLGTHKINIRFMHVASYDGEDLGPEGEKRGNEALMILGVDVDVDKVVLCELSKCDGVLNVNAVRL
ncbi:phosphoglycerate dehydrogenase [Zalerion maritima]|uniref:D-3-phosphoglycerate dehydrogenase n=1 Tax=Zalerion maritima TaxID=339359 RepID=A0AAD5WPY7_9PEZI|nr:phosphoglycerate dehydrogenase [Zalerion maritima]